MAPDYSLSFIEEFRLGEDEFINFCIKTLIEHAKAYRIRLLLPESMLDVLDLKFPYLGGQDFSFFIDHSEQVLSPQARFMTELFRDKEKLLGLLNKSLSEGLNLSCILTKMNPEIIELDFFYNEESNAIERNLDEATVYQAKEIQSRLRDETYKEDYERCVKDFVNYSDMSQQDYWASIDRMKKILEDTAKVNYGIEKPFARGGKQLLGVLCEDNDKELKAIVDFIIAKLHHPTGKDNSGQENRINLNRKKFDLIWLQLNNIIYILERNKKSKV